jgi:hypothetical protein
MLGQVKSALVWLGVIRSGYYRLYLVSTVYIWLAQVRSD